MKESPNAATNRKDESECFEELQKLLALAVKLELFTIPFYFYTYYSLKDPKTFNAGIHLREVIMEEMLHLAIVSNIMHALKDCKPPAYSPIKDIEAGGKCADRLIKKYVPNYPNHPPIYVPRDEVKAEGDIRKEPPQKAPFLSLDSLTIVQIVAFMRMELPDLSEKNDDEDWETIGEFYNYVKRQFLRCSKLEFESKKQIDLHTHNPTKGRNALNPVRNLKDALDSIDFIVEQGEGATFYNLANYSENYRRKSETWEEATEVESELSHFYHFLLIYEGMGGEQKFSINDKKFDEEKFRSNFNLDRYKEFRRDHVLNIVKDPAQALERGWYPPEAVEANLIFNSNYSRLLDRLTYASVDDHRLNFGIALEQMNKFDELAANVTDHPLNEKGKRESKDDTLLCGPSFEYICPLDRL